MEGYFRSLGELYEREPAPAASVGGVPKPLPPMASEKDSSPIEGVYEESVKVMTDYFENAARFYNWNQKK